MRGPATEERAPELPAPVIGLLADLRLAGHAAYVVGGCLRDRLLGRTPSDWDLTTDARPERIQAVFPGSLYENRFGTVLVRRDGLACEVTTFRREFAYADHRHPDRVEFGDSIDEDLARRDFTVNAMAYGGPPPMGPADGLRLVDPHGGRDDLAARLLRAVGDPDARFHEDALRMIRAVRLAATLEFEIEPATLAAVARNASLADVLSGERMGAELEKLLGAPRPSVGLRLMAETGLLAVVAPELARQRGVPQGKVGIDDLWEHTLLTVDAAPRERQLVRLAALVHDIGKPATFTDGHFHGHDTVGADLAVTLLAELRFPRAVQERVAHLVRHHMFAYEPRWSDATVRRFIRRIGPAAVDDLIALRAADNAGSGLPAAAGHLAELRARCRAQLEAKVALGRGDLAVDGHDLMAELDVPPGPRLGWLLDELTERVVAEPERNDRASLLATARDLLRSDA
ncbi:MAG TPA: HD domain-containing protein [Candidatus Limnocylindrales bacterium]